jgi:hypothetical protein
VTADAIEQSDIEHYLQYLHGTPRQRGLALQGLSSIPVPDPRLLAICEALLEDRTIALLGIPYCFGEIRWCAADAVASLRRALQISEPVVVRDAFAPVSTAQAVRLAEAAGVTPKGEVEGIIGALETLAQMDRLPRRTITRTP